MHEARSNVYLSELMEKQRKKPRKKNTLIEWRELVYYSWCLEYLLISTRTHTDLSKSFRRIYYWLVPFGHGKGEKMEVSHRNGGIDQQIIAW